MPLTVVSETQTQGKYISFTDVGPSESGKTRKFEVVSTEDKLLLGRVLWFGHWRKYVFLPSAGTCYEEICLGEIAEFIKRKTIEHRQRFKLARVVWA